MNWKPKLAISKLISIVNGSFFLWWNLILGLEILINIFFLSIVVPKQNSTVTYNHQIPIGPFAGYFKPLIWLWHWLIIPKNHYHIFHEAIITLHPNGLLKYTMGTLRMNVIISSLQVVRKWDFFKCSVFKRYFTHYKKMDGNKKINYFLHLFNDIWNTFWIPGI